MRNDPRIHLQPTTFLSMRLECVAPIGGYRRGTIRVFTAQDLDVRSRFLLAEEDARRISRHLREDAAFLKANNLIDYSLLVGVTKTRYEIEGAAQRRDTAVVGSGPGDGVASAPFHRLDSGGLAAAYVEGAELYSMGIIDILQDFNLRKRAEYLIKRFVCCQGKGVSVHPAGEYGDRFVRNVVEALIEPVRLGAEPRVIRGYTPAGSPLGMFDLKQSERRVALGRNRTRAAPVVPHPQQPQPFGAERSGVWAPPRTSPRLVAAELGRHTDGSSGGLPTTEPPRAFTFPRDGAQEREHAKPASGQQQHQERGADCSPSDERRCELM